MSDTLEVVASTGARVTRDGAKPGGGWGPWHEVLDPAGANLDRLNHGAPLTLDHQPRSDLQVGVVERAYLQGGNIIAKVRFSKEPQAQRYYRDVVDKIRRNVSVGYRVDAWRDDTRKGERLPTYTAVDWEIVELSLVPIGADMNASFRDHPEQLRTRSMTVSTATIEPVEPAVPDSTALDPVATERSRVSAIFAAARGFHADLGMAADLVAQGVDVDTARARLLNSAVERDRATGIGPNIMGGADYTDPSGIAEDIATAWAHRCNPAVKLDARAAQYRGLRTAECLRQWNGIRPGTSEREIVKRAATTSDFPGILASALNKGLQPVYQTARSGLVELAAKDTVRDFRTASRLRAGEFPALLVVNEHGEYQYGSLGEGKETFTLKKYGRIFSVSWEALVNDDLDALSAASRTGGLAAANLEADLLAERVNSNPTMADGVAVFNATHGNTGTAGVISTTTVGELTGKMRLQKGLDGATILNIRPRYLAVPSGLETVARQLVATISPATTTADNSMFRDLTVVVDPRLDAGDVNGWFLFADPGVAPTLTLAHLEGEEGPVTESRNGFNVDAVEVKVRHVAAAYWADFRGAGSNVGA